MSEFRNEQDWLRAFAAQDTISGVELLLDKLSREREKRHKTPMSTAALDGFHEAVRQIMAQGMTETEAVKMAVAALSDGLLFQTREGQHR